MNTQNRARKLNKANKTAIIYARKSLDGEGVQENSLRVQSDACHAFASKHGLSVLALFEEVGVSGTTSFSECEALKAAMLMCQEQKIAYLLVHRADRLSRSIAKMYQVKAIFAEHGTKVVTVEDGFQNDDEVAMMREAMNAMFAEATVRLLRKRVKETLQNKKRRMEKYTRIAPYGFMWSDRKMVENPQEQVVLNRISELHSQGFSSNRIATILNSHGIFSRKGTKFSQKLVWRILNREGETA